MIPQRAILMMLVAAVLAGCAAPSDANQVSATDNQFTPNSASLEQNDRMTWENDGDMTHSVTIHKGGEPATTLRKDTDIAPGASTSFTFEEAGTFHVYCKYHSGGGAGDFSTGMVMTVTVA